MAVERRPPVTMAMIRGRGTAPPKRPFRLGKIASMQSTVISRAGMGGASEIPATEVKQRIETFKQRKEERQIRDLKQFDPQAAALAERGDYYVAERDKTVNTISTLDSRREKLLSDFNKVRLTGMVVKARQIANEIRSVDAAREGLVGRVRFLERNAQGKFNQAQASIGKQVAYLRSQGIEVIQPGAVETAKLAAPPEQLKIIGPPPDVTRFTKEQPFGLESRQSIALAARERARRPARGEPFYVTPVREARELAIDVREAAAGATRLGVSTLYAGKEAGLGLGPAALPYIGTVQREEKIAAGLRGRAPGEAVGREAGVFGVEAGTLVFGGPAAAAYYALSAPTVEEAAFSAAGGAAAKFGLKGLSIASKAVPTFLQPAAKAAGKVGTAGILGGVGGLVAAEVAATGGEPEALSRVRASTISSFAGFGLGFQAVGGVGKGLSGAAGRVSAALKARPVLPGTGRGVVLEEIRPGVFGVREGFTPTTVGPQVSPRPGFFRFEGGKAVRVEPPLKKEEILRRLGTGKQVSPRPGFFRFEGGKAVPMEPPLKKEEVLRRLGTGLQVSPRPGFFRFEGGKAVPMEPPLKKEEILRRLGTGKQVSPRPGFFRFEGGKAVPVQPPLKKEEILRRLGTGRQISPRPGFFRIEGGKIVPAPRPLTRLEQIAAIPTKAQVSKRPGIFRFEEGKLIQVAKFPPGKRRFRPFPPEKPAESIQEVIGRGRTKTVQIFKTEEVPKPRVRRRAFLVPGSFSQLSLKLQRLPPAREPREGRRGYSAYDEKMDSIGEALRDVMPGAKPFAGFKDVPSIFAKPGKTPIEKMFKAGVAEGPKLGEYRGGLTPALAGALGVSPSAVREKEAFERELKKLDALDAFLESEAFAESQRIPSKQAAAFSPVNAFESALKDSVNVVRGQRVDFSTAQKIVITPAERKAIKERTILRDAVLPRVRAAVDIREAFRVGFKEITKQKIPTITRTPPFILPKRRRAKKKAIAERGFDTFVKIRGRFVKVNPKPLYKGTALALGRTIVDRASPATFKIVKGKSPPTGKMLRAPQLRKFRKPIRKGVSQSGSPLFIEKNKYRIDTPGEKKQITKKGLETLKRGFFKRKKKRKKTKRR